MKSTVTGEKPPGEKVGYVRLGFRQGAFHRGANVPGAFHLEPKSTYITKDYTRLIHLMTKYAATRYVYCIGK